MFENTPSPSGFDDCMLTNIQIAALIGAQENLTGGNKELLKFLIGLNKHIAQGNHHAVLLEIQRFNKDMGIMQQWGMLPKDEIYRIGNIQASILVAMLSLEDKLGLQPKGGEVQDANDKVKGLVGVVFDPRNSSV